MVLQNSESKRGTSEKDGEKQRRNEEKSVERRKPCGVCIERITRTGNATSFYYVTIPATASIPTEPSTQLDVFLAITTASRCLHCVTCFSMHPQTPYSTSYQNISSAGKRIVAESRARTVHPLKFFPRCMNSPPPRFLIFVDSSF